MTPHKTIKIKTMWKWNRITDGCDKCLTSIMDGASLQKFCYNLAKISSSTNSNCNGISQERVHDDTASNNTNLSGCSSGMLLLKWSCMFCHCTKLLRIWRGSTHKMPSHLWLSICCKADVWTIQLLWTATESYLWFQIIPIICQPTQITD